MWTHADRPTARVFLHYWGGSRRTFAPVIASLSSRCTVVYDRRGWGAARDLPGPYGINQLADDVLDVVRELGLDRYVLVGHSMGGRWHLAAPRNLEGLTGCGPRRPGTPARPSTPMPHRGGRMRTPVGVLAAETAARDLTNVASSRLDGG